MIFIEPSSRGLTATLTIAVALVAAGCGDSSGGTDSSSKTSTQSQGREVREPGDEGEFHGVSEVGGSHLQGERRASRRSAAEEAALPYDPPAGGEFARARYLGAARLSGGGWVDVWLTDIEARAAELSASFEDPSLTPPEAKDWYFDHVQELVVRAVRDGHGRWRWQGIRSLPAEGLGQEPRRFASLQYTMRVLPSLSSRPHSASRAAIAARSSRACRSLRAWTIASSQ